MNNKLQPEDSLQAVEKQARTFGEELATMLSVSNYTQAEKDAWASLIPHMTIEEIERFFRILQKNLQGQIAHEMEDTILLAKALQMKRDFALSSAKSTAIRELNAIEKELDRLENAGR